MKVFRFVTRHAYICVSLYADSFWTAAKRAHVMLQDHGQFLISLNALMSFYITLARVVIISEVTVGCFYLYKEEPNRDVILTSVFAVSWIVTRSVLDLPGMAVDAVVVCYCADREHNNGRDLPYYSRTSLQTVMEKLNDEFKAKTQKNEIAMKERANKWKFFKTSMDRKSIESQFSFEERPVVKQVVTDSIDLS